MVKLACFKVISCLFLSILINCGLEYGQFPSDSNKLVFDVLLDDKASLCKCERLIFVHSITDKFSDLVCFEAIHFDVNAREQVLSDIL